MAVNCCVVPTAIPASSGVTVIDTSAADNTVRVTEFVTEPDVAVIVVPPDARLVANP